MSVRDPWLVEFGDSKRRQVTLMAWWLDRQNRGMIDIL